MRARALKNGDWFNPLPTGATQNKHLTLTQDVMAAAGGAGQAPRDMGSGGGPTTSRDMVSDSAYYCSVT